MFERVTTATIFADSRRNLQNSISALSRAQNAASSQRAITRPSDDPSATADALKIRGQQKANDQYTRNVNDGNGWLATADSALSQTTTALRRARDLTVQGANDGSMSATAKEAIAKELESIRDGLLATSNTKYLGRSVFAGSSDASAAYDSSYNWSGTAGDTVMRRVGEGQTVQVDVDGSTVFGNGSNSVFSDLDTIINNLRSGVNVQPGIAAIDARMTAIQGAQSQVGSRQSAVDNAQSINASQKVLLESQRSGIEDVDTANAIMELQMQNNAYQASLAVTSKTLQTSLMDFLK